MNGKTYLLFILAVAGMAILLLSGCHQTAPTVITPEQIRSAPRIVTVDDAISAFGHTRIEISPGKQPALHYQVVVSNKIFDIRFHFNETGYITRVDITISGHSEAVVQSN